MPKKAIIVAKGCPSCSELEKNGGCKDNTCIDIAQTDQSIGSSIKFVPEMACWSKASKKWIKCKGNEIEKVLKKYNKKK